MFEDDGGFSILGHHYRRVTDLDEKICAGDIVRFVPPLDRDAEWYMFEMRHDSKGRKVMTCINWIGYKAGLQGNSCVQEDGFIAGTNMVPLAWFEENWSSHFVGEGSFEHAQFFKFQRQ